MSLSVSSLPAAVRAPAWPAGGATVPASRQRLALALLARLSGGAGAPAEPWVCAVDALFPAAWLAARPHAAAGPLAFCLACADALPASALRSPAARRVSGELLPGLQALWRAECRPAPAPH